MITMYQYIYSNIHGSTTITFKHPEPHCALALGLNTDTQTVVILVFC